MLTQQDIDDIRKNNAVYVQGLTRAWTVANVQRKVHHRQYRSVELALLRLCHVYNSVTEGFNKICWKTNRPGYMKPITQVSQVLSSKYTATILSILDVISSQDIQLERWILAQAETIRIPYFSLHHCWGANALSRYESWEARQQKKFLKTAERDEQTDSKYKTIEKSVSESHQTALKWARTLSQIDAPSLSVALWYLWPAVSAWYLLSYDEFRKDIMEPGVCTTPVLVKQWKQYTRSPRISRICETALRDAIAAYGKLSW